MTSDTSTGDAERCDRRGCDRDPEYQMRTESPILHEDPTEWFLCEEHVHVAVREFRGSTNILTSREITTQPEPKQTRIVTDGGTDQSEYKVEIDARVRYTEEAPSEEIARHNAKQEFIFDVDADLDDIEIVATRDVSECNVDTDTEHSGDTDE